MSRRSKRAVREPARQAAQDLDSSAPGADHRPTGGILRDVAVLLLAFGAGVGLAELFGAANLGVAFGIGQIVFAIALVVLLTRD